MKATRIVTLVCALSVSWTAGLRAGHTVWVDFDSTADTSLGAAPYSYSAGEKGFIIDGLNMKFAGLGVDFVPVMPTSGLFSTVTLNTSISDSDGVDFQNKKKFDTARVHAPANFAFIGEMSPTPGEIVVGTINLVAHEAAHLYGAEHDDAWTEIGTGVSAPAFATAFEPDYPGPLGAGLTGKEIMSLTTGIGFSKAKLVDPDLFFGPRSAAKILYGSGPPVDADVDEFSGDHNSSHLAAQELTLKTFEIPNNYPAGHPKEFHKFFADVAIVEEASLGLVDPFDPPDPPEADYYSVTGAPGDVYQIQALSDTISHQMGVDDVVDMQIAILDPLTGAAGLYYGTLGNDDARISTDSMIVDFVSTDGKFVIEVFPSFTGGNIRGEYELYVMRFRSVVPEPSTWALALLAAAALVIFVWRTRRTRVGKVS